MFSVLKGLGLGASMLFVFTFVYFWACGMIGSNMAVGVGVVRSLTIGRPLYWIASALFLALGVVLVAIWPNKL